MNSLFQSFYNNKFADIYPDYEGFLSDYNTLGFSKVFNSEDTLKTLYFLLLGRYANSTIANSDNGQFRLQLFSIIWQYGGTWEKRVDIQKALRELSLEDGSDIYKGSKAIYNSALNPGTAPTTATLEELPHINGQNTTNYKKSKLEGLATLSSLLESDVTNYFLNKFQGLFIPIALGQSKYYITEEV